MDRAVDQSRRDGTLVVAPHPDDAAWSIGGTIGLLRRPVALLTVFGRTSYTREGGFEADADGVTRRRRSEDQAFAARFDLDWEYLELESAGLRSPNPASIFIDSDEDGAVLDGDRRAVGARVETGLRAAMERWAPRAVVAPAGIGGHRDHLIVRDTAVRLANATGMDLVYYEDLPYALALSDDQLTAVIGRVDPTAKATYVPIGGTLAAKLSAVSLYRSQVDQRALDGVVEAATKWGPPMERLWARPEIVFLESLR